MTKTKKQTRRHRNPKRPKQDSKQAQRETKLTKRNQKHLQRDENWPKGERKQWKCHTVLKTNPKNLQNSGRERKQSQTQNKL